MCKVLCATEPEAAFQYYLQHRMASPGGTLIVGLKKSAGLEDKLMCKGSRLEQLGNEFRTLKAHTSQTVLKGQPSLHIIQYYKIFNQFILRVNSIVRSLMSSLSNFHFYRNVSLFVSICISVYSHFLLFCDRQGHHAQFSDRSSL